MATETWRSIAVPLLEHFANHEMEYATANGAIETRAIAETEGLDIVAAEQELVRLYDGGYLAGAFHPEAPGDSWMIRPTLTVIGARAARIWPPDQAAEALQMIIERRLAEAETPDERRFWRKIKDGFAGVPAVTCYLHPSGSIETSASTTSPDNLTRRRSQWQRRPLTPSTAESPQRPQLTQWPVPPIIGHSLR